MQKKLMLLTVCIMASFAFVPANLPVENPVFPTVKTSEIVLKKAIPLSVEEKIKNLYEEFSSNNTSMPSLISFEKGMLGYYKLSKSGKIKNSILTIVDFSLPSSQKRMWILDMDTHTVLFHTLVAHGKNTGLGMATDFSNVNSSHKSSLGFYLTAETYFGKHGLSLRLDGLEKGINNNARTRAIVIHGADYATKAFVKKAGRLGRSYGCPSVPSKLSKEIIQTIKEKSCLFIYYPSKKYMENSRFINS